MVVIFNREQGTAAKNAFLNILAGGVIFCKCGSSLPVCGNSPSSKGVL